jgi:hypothetical protein
MARSPRGVERPPSPKLENLLRYHVVSADLTDQVARSDAGCPLQDPRARTELRRTLCIDIGFTRKRTRALASRIFSRCNISCTKGINPQFPNGIRQFRIFRVHHEHREELGRLRLAGIGADAVAVAGQLGEALSGLVGRLRPVVDLTANLPLKHGRVGSK